MTHRRFLYLSPHFPPSSRVGAIRPLKFARHLPDYGWAPVVLCDFSPGDRCDFELERAIPASTVVVRNYSPSAQGAYESIDRSPDRAPRPSCSEQWVQTLPPDSPQGPIERIRRELNGRDVIPLGEGLFNVRHAIAAGRRCLLEHPCEAIFASAPPAAGLLVAHRLSLETGLPLIVDLRDPWGPCELRRPLRIPPTRWIEDRIERRIVRQAARVVLNTRTTRDQYRGLFPDIDPDRFVYIRNHHDQALIGSGVHPGFDRFTLFFLGTFSRFVRPDALIELLGELARRGVTAKRFQLVMTDPPGTAATHRARELGVFEMLRLSPWIPYPEIGALMQAADLLVLISAPPGRQRIVAKFYDYMASGRPFLAISANPEMRELMNRAGFGKMIGPGEVSAMADYVQEVIAQGPGADGAQGDTALSSARASKRLAALLDAVTGNPT